jgi:hypothetical protein
MLVDPTVYFRSYAPQSTAHCPAMDSTERPLTPPTVASDRPLLGPFHKSLPKISQQESIPDLVRVAEEEDLGVSTAMDYVPQVVRPFHIFFHVRETPGIRKTQVDYSSSRLWFLATLFSMICTSL